MTHPDDRLDIFQYFSGTYTPNANPTQPGTFSIGAGTDELHEIWYFTLASPGGVPYKSIVDQRIYNNLGEQLVELNYVNDGTIHQPAKGTLWYYDTYGHVTTVNHSDGRTSDR